MTHSRDKKLWSRWWIVLSSFVAAVQAQHRSNIVFIMVDDMGWNDVSFHGSDQILTPNIDTMAYRGIILQQYYSEPVCTPARTALLTGKYPMRLGMQGFPLYNSEDRGIPLKERLLPSYLKELGYSTHLVGKWHVGMSRKEYLPTSRGYDTHYGMRGGFIDYYTYNKVETLPNGTSLFGMDLFDNDVPQEQEERYIVDALTDRAVKRSQRKPWTNQRILEVINEVKKAQMTINTGQRRPAMGYYWLSKYDIMTTPSEDFLISKRRTPTASIVRVIPREQYFDILSEVHGLCGHGGRDKILHDIKNRYYIPKKAVEIFVSLCPICETKRNGPKKSIVKKPFVPCDFNLRGQVDLIDFSSSPDGEFKWILNYQDNATKFFNLRPLKTSEPAEVASELLKIFLVFGAPYILQSTSGREFTAKVIKEIVVMWPKCKIVHGRPCHLQIHDSIGSVEKNNQNIENMLRVWMNENKSTNWSVGCFFVQYNNNASFNKIIGKSPYEALFGSEPKAGLSGSNIPMTVLSTIETEEELNTFSGHEPAEAMCSDDSINNSSETEMQNTDIIDIKGEPEIYIKSNNAHIKLTGNDIIEIKVEPDPLNINYIEENNVPKGIKRAAENMVGSTTTVKKMPTLDLDIGSSVIVNVPKVDRGPLKLKSIQGKIVDIKNGVYRVGTKNGTIKNWFSRQQLKYSDTNYGDAILETPITLREAVASQSPFEGHGFQKCSCKPAVNQCRNNRCACFKNKVPCGSKCHGSLACVNK